MESPVMYDTAAHQAQNQGGAGGELKKSNQILNNNNSALQVNHNQQQSGNSPVVSKVSASKASVHQQYADHIATTGELTDLNTPEISIDLQHLIDDSHFNDGLLDMLSNGSSSAAAAAHVVKAHARGQQQPQAQQSQQQQQGYPRTTLAYMPQPVHGGASYHQNNNSCSDSNSSSSDSPSIKEEPLDPADYRRHCPQYPTAGYSPAANNAGPFTNAGPTFTTLTPSNVHPNGNNPVHHLGHQQAPQPRLPGAGMKQQSMMSHQHHHAAAAAAAAAVARKQTKAIDKASDEYRRRRERNNIAVRKSREKAKVRSRETEEKVKLLVKDNELLKKRIELLTEELNVLRSLISSVGVSSDHLHREITRHLDQFQNTMGPM